MHSFTTLGHVFNVVVPALFWAIVLVLALAYIAHRKDVENKAKHDAFDREHVLEPMPEALDTDANGS